MIGNPSACNLCLSHDTQLLGKVGLDEGSVTSDSQLHSSSAILWLCRNCSHIQKISSPEELKEIEKIYSSYQAHYLSNGIEQLTSMEGKPRPRSFFVLDKIKNSLRSKGKLLDIGAGNGAVLNSATQLLPEWELYAFDVSDHCRKAIESISGVKLFVTDLNKLKDQKFDLIVLWHVLEHVPYPSAFIQRIKTLLSPGGLLLLQVPDLEQNVFDLAVFDHVSHFSKSTLEAFFVSCGFKLKINGNDWISNCLTYGFQPVSVSKDVKPNSSSKHSLQTTPEALNGLIANFRNSILDDSTRFAIFGTSQAALFTYQQMNRKPLCFIDEDQHRQGRKLLELEVVGPEKINKKVKILMPFAKERGVQIAERLTQNHKNIGMEQFVFCAY